jgi:hypothetical protein
MFKNFCLGFFSIFEADLNASSENVNDHMGLEKYINLAEKDLYLSYQKLKNNNERK